jgi:MATE family multidrug resistance protein
MHYLGSQLLGGLIHILSLQVCIDERKISFTYCAFSGSAQVSNHLGAGNHKAAQVVVRAVLSISLVEAVIVSTNIFCFRHVFGYAFSNEKVVVDYVTEVAPLLCLSVIVDSLQTVLSG